MRVGFFGRDIDVIIKIKWVGCRFVGPWTWP